MNWIVVLHLQQLGHQNAVSGLYHGTDGALLIFLGVTGCSSAVLLGAARCGEHGRGYTGSGTVSATRGGVGEDR